MLMWGTMLLIVLVQGEDVCSRLWDGLCASRRGRRALLRYKIFPSTKAPASPMTYDEFNGKVDSVWERTDWRSDEFYPLSAFKATSSLVAGVVGCGILGLPACIYFAGFTGFVLMVTMTAVLSYLGGVYLGRRI